jgi:transglutaminase-like putative cysteine protease
MRFTIRHVTRFSYETPITESVMEARMQPLSDAWQRCLHFALTTVPQSRIMVYQDHDGNTVHHFDIPGRHARLTLIAEAMVDSVPPDPLPGEAAPTAWADLDALAASGEWFEFLARSTFTGRTPLLDELADEFKLGRDDHPLMVIQRVMTQISSAFEYRPLTTRVDSPIDDALSVRQGVCQDFAHIFIALMRRIGIPTRYVSGYLFHDAASPDRSASNATHAWAESFLPGVGWIGVDPTNDMLAGERHIRVAIGRDYADVPPTRGVYKGSTGVRAELAVDVRVGPARPASDPVPFTPWMSREAGAPLTETTGEEGEQQQQ